MTRFNYFKNILLVGIGNVLRSDDGVGVYIANGIKKRPPFDTLIVEVSIENYIGKINKMETDLLIFIDCVDLGKEPGYFSLMPIEKIKNYTWNTHNISLREVTKLFNTSVFILGVQPSSLDIGEEMSQPVQEAADRLIDLFNRSKDPLGILIEQEEITSV